MTDEQFLHFTSRMRALEVFVAALCDAHPDQPELRRLVDVHREVYETATLNSPAPEDVRSETLRRIDAFAAGLWGKEG